MLRVDRSLTERLFHAGLIKTLMCTATLAWGVNLPAHTVVIKGTQIYDPKAGGFKDLGVLDVMQIFGRAGRPQFDSSGEAIILTTHDKLSHYLSMLNHQLPIESQFISNLPNSLNAEVVLGTVSSIKDAISWLSYTYLFVRMLRNPLVYGISYEEKAKDPNLMLKRTEILENAAKRLDSTRMLRFNPRTGQLNATDLGRVASLYYIQFESVNIFNEKLHDQMSDQELLAVFTSCHEFENIKVRDDELQELDQLMHSYCRIPVKGGVENPHGKVNVLLQTYLSKGAIDGFSLVADTNYVFQNAGRIMRALFEICLKKGWASMANRLLTFAKMIDRRLWDFQHPLRQFTAGSYSDSDFGSGRSAGAKGSVGGVLPLDVINRLEAKNLSVDILADMTPGEIGSLVNNPSLGRSILKYVETIPYLELNPVVQPITRSILRVILDIIPAFHWSDRWHGSTEPFWLWVEDAENEHIYHSEYIILQKKAHENGEPMKISFTIPIFEPLPPQYFIRITSDRWLGAESVQPISFQHLILPERHPPHTDLLDLQPLPREALHNVQYESLYKFSHFNPIQTQVFHTLYHTDHNVLLGAPTGSGKTIVAELAMLRVFNEKPDAKVIYVAPLKALARERMSDWKVRLAGQLGKRLVELTGDFTPDVAALQSADILVTTPEKWDGISRNWQHRTYVTKVALVVIDEIHLLGQDRGPVLEVIVSRMRYIASHLNRPVRFVGLSTALANARDVADWLGIDRVGLFNFKPSVRPVPIEVHVEGFAEKHYCPRMATMNKPTFAAIQQYSADKPVLIFVSSRRQTRLTALDLISYCAAEDNPRMFLKISEPEIESIVNRVRDKSLKHTLIFGIGMHHAGLTDQDRCIVESLFVNGQIQVLVCTSTLAWGVNFPAHLVVVKGTEYYDAKEKQYVDFPITDVLQMMGRAGRPQFDDTGIAVILVHEPKRNFYKKFLYEPFPVESSLAAQLPDHINAEIVSGTIGSIQQALDYLTWTYFFRRLTMNPSYYNLEEASASGIHEYLIRLIEDTLVSLEQSGCIYRDETGIKPLPLGRIASFYYLSHRTVKIFSDRIRPELSWNDLLCIISGAAEFDELPVRHNEDQINAELATMVPLSVDMRTVDDPHTKAHLLFQAHFHRISLPISDYITDTKSVLDQCIRVIQAFVDVSAERGFLASTIRAINLIQMVIQGRWFTDSTLINLPHLDSPLVLNELARVGIDCLPQLMMMSETELRKTLSNKKLQITESGIAEILNVVKILPSIDVSVSIQNGVGSDEKQYLSADQPLAVVLPKEQDAYAQIVLNRLNKNVPLKAFAPKFPKPKDVSWWVIIGHEETDELLALKRLTVKDRLHTSLSFMPLNGLGANQMYSVYVMSDSYLGLDQQYQFTVTLTDS
eukprot:GILK01010071.1.p1 GENE.GILK01010071.1~~GILK01010071.1.p1  ORF type:complete len:1391 (-),score=337.99 GILK01010071.1:97-4269(-)